MAEVENGRWYASRGVANTGLGLGIAGTALGLMASGNNGDGWSIFGNRNSDYVSKETFEKQTRISELESKLALSEAEKVSEQKMIDVYTKITERLMADEKAYNVDKQNQMVINANVQSAIAVNTNNINQLMNMTQLYVKASSVTPEPMPRYNSWTEPTTSSSSGT